MSRKSGGITPISVRITKEDRDYLDVEIKKGHFASYGHALRGLLYYYKQSRRSIERMRGENAVLRAKIKELNDGNAVEET